MLLAIRVKVKHALRKGFITKNKKRITENFEWNPGSLANAKNKKI